MTENFYNVFLDIKSLFLLLKSKKISWEISKLGPIMKEEYPIPQIFGGIS